MKLFKLPIKYIIQGIKNYILDLVSDIKYKDIFDQRYNICIHCDKRDGHLCSVCGCVLKFKTKSEDSRCPIDKWDKIKREESI